MTIAMKSRSRVVMDDHRWIRIDYTRHSRKECNKRFCAVSSPSIFTGIDGSSNLSHQSANKGSQRDKDYGSNNGAGSDLAEQSDQSVAAEIACHFPGEEIPE